MTKEEKQIELLNRLYTNIEHYKDLRLRIPAMFGGIQIGLVSYILGADSFTVIFNEKTLFAIALFSFGLFGIISYRFVHNQYNDIVDDIYHLWEKIGMVGEDFFKADKGSDNKKGKAPKIFLIGYISIVLFTLIGIISIYIK